MEQPKYSQTEQNIPESTITSEVLSDFCRNVNQYLHQYIVVADAKIFALVGINATLAALLLASQSTASWTAIIIRGAIISFGISVLIGVVALYPQLQSGRKGLIFWEDILTRGTLAEYQADLQKLSVSQVEKEYTQENYYLSKILHQKYRYIGWCIIFFILGLFFAVVGKVF